MPGRFELTHVKLRHYRSIAACDVALQSLSILVGPNGAGKSNFVDSLRLVADSLQTTLDNALRDRGGVAEVRRRSTGHPTHFSIDLTFTTDDGHGTYGFQIAAVRGGDFAVQREACRWVELGKDESFYEIRDGALVRQSEAFMPAPVPDRLYLVAASGIEGFRRVFNGLSGIGVYNINPDAMRRPQSPDSGDLLRRDGSNIASVIERLRREEPELKARIEEYLAVVVPGLRRVSRSAIGSFEVLGFDQEVPGAKAPWQFQAVSMSDGTLRALGVLTALFADSAVGDNSPVAVEEPEAALHPAAARALLDALQDASSSRQVVVTTHSVDLLDSSDVGPEQLLAVRSDRGSSVISSVDRAGRRALEEELFTAGELLRADQLQPEQSTFQQLDLLA